MRQDVARTRRAKNKNLFFVLSAMCLFLGMTTGAMARPTGRVLLHSVPSTSVERNDPVETLGRGIYTRTALSLQLACIERSHDGQCAKMRFLLTSAGERQLVGDIFDLGSLMSEVMSRSPQFDSAIVGAAIIFLLAFCDQGEFCPSRFIERTLMAGAGIVLLPVGAVVDVVQLLTLGPRRGLFRRAQTRAFVALADGNPDAQPIRVSQRTLRSLLNAAGASHIGERG